MNRANVGFKAVMLKAAPSETEKESNAYLFLTDEHLKTAQDAGLTKEGDLSIKVLHNANSEKSVWVKPLYSKSSFMVKKLPQLETLASLVKDNDAKKESIDDTIMQDIAEDIEEVRNNRSKEYAEEVNRALCSDRD